MHKYKNVEKSIYFTNLDFSNFQVDANNTDENKTHHEC